MTADIESQAINSKTYVQRVRTDFKKNIQYVFYVFALIAVFKLVACVTEITEEKPTSWPYGIKVDFGPFSWVVLYQSCDRKLVITEEIVRMRTYHRLEDWSLTWEQSDVRRYLNYSFLEQFTYEEIGRIAETHVVNSDNLWFDSSFGEHFGHFGFGGSDTVDRVFLLSLEEADKYFGNSGDYLNQVRFHFFSGRRGMELLLSDYGIMLSNVYNNYRITNYSGKPSAWWLRSPGGFQVRAANVAHDGMINVAGTEVTSSSIGVRPAVWLYF